MILWFTGLSGSGKTTLCNLLMQKLKSSGYSVEWYDGDRVREELKIESDFSREGILKNNFEVINKINRVKENADFILISLITPFREVREYARNLFGEDYFEIYVKCDKNTLVERDTKGLYKKAIEGKLNNLIGFGDELPYEEPSNADLILETNMFSPEDAIEKIQLALKIVV